jgi:hypothetical protein
MAEESGLIAIKAPDKIINDLASSGLNDATGALINLFNYAQITSKVYERETYCFDNCSLVEEYLIMEYGNNCCEWSYVAAALLQSKLDIEIYAYTSNEYGGKEYFARRDNDNKVSFNIDYETLDEVLEENPDYANITSEKVRVWSSLIPNILKESCPKLAFIESDALHYFELDDGKNIIIEKGSIALKGPDDILKKIDTIENKDSTPVLSELFDYYNVDKSILDGSSYLFDYARLTNGYLVLEFGEINGSEWSDIAGFLTYEEKSIEVYAQCNSIRDEAFYWFIFDGDEYRTNSTYDAEQFHRMNRDDEESLKYIRWEDLIGDIEKKWVSMLPEQIKESLPDFCTKNLDLALSYRT